MTRLELFQRNLNLAYWFAVRAARRFKLAHALDDLKQEAALRLWRATESAAELGGAFGAYAIATCKYAVLKPGRGSFVDRELRYRTRAVSLELEGDSGEAFERREIEDLRVPTADEILTKAMLEQFIDRLPDPRQREVVRCRLAGLTLEAIGRRLARELWDGERVPLSRERVRQIEEQALQSLRELVTLRLRQEKAPGAVGRAPAGIPSTSGAPGAHHG